MIGGHNLLPLVEIGLTDLSKYGGPRAPKFRQPCRPSSSAKRDVGGLVDIAQWGQNLNPIITEGGGF